MLHWSRHEIPVCCCNTAHYAMWQILGRKIKYTDLLQIRYLCKTEFGYLYSCFCINDELSEWSWTKPFVLHQYTSILQNSPDFVDDDLHLDQQPAVPSTCCDVTFNSVVGEVGESKRAIGPHIKS